MRKLGSVGVLLGVGVGDGLVEGAPHCNVVCEIGGQASVEVRPVLKMRGETSVLHGQVVILLLVHLLVDDILFRDTQ